MITLRTFPYRLDQFWFSEGPARGCRPDIAEFCQRPQPWPGAASKAKHTLTIDLTQPSETLFQAVHKDTRAEIRRADRDGVVLEVQDAKQSLVRDDFLGFYNGFAAAKGLHPLNALHLECAASSGALDISAARAADGTVLVMHAHLVCPGRVRLLHSASHFRDVDAAKRQSIGRANRWLHWRDIERFKTAGAKLYDFGGWYAGQTDETLLRINKFKEEFGGRPVQEWNSVVAMTPRGRLVLMFRRLRSRRAAVATA